MLEIASTRSASERSPTRDASGGRWLSTPDRFAPLVGSGLIVLALVLMLALPSLPLASSRDVSLPFLSGIGERQVLVATGYVGCGDVCPANLALLASVRAARVDAEKPALVFVNVDLGSTTEVSATYARSFDASFNSYVLTPSDVSDVEAALSLRAYSDGKDLVNHLGTIFLFERSGDQRWQLRRAFLRDVSRDVLLSALS